MMNLCFVIVALHNPLCNMLKRNTKYGKLRKKPNVFVTNYALIYKTIEIIYLL